MTNSVTKTQIKYLEDKLERIVDNKMKDVARQIPPEEAYELLKGFKFTVKAYTQPEKNSIYSGEGFVDMYTNIKDFMKAYREISNKYYEKYKERRQQLRDYCQTIMDAYVLNNIEDLSDMLKKLEEM